MRALAAGGCKKVSGKEAAEEERKSYMSKARKKLREELGKIFGRQAGKRKASKIEKRDGQEKGTKRGFFLG